MKPVLAVRKVKPVLAVRKVKLVLAVRKVKLVLGVRKVKPVLAVRKVKPVLVANKVSKGKKVTREILLKLQLLVEKMATVLTLHLHFLEKSLLLLTLKMVKMAVHQQLT